MKKIYMQPESIVVTLHTEGMIAASLGRGEGVIDNSQDILTNKKSFWDTEDVEEETSGIW